MKKTVKLLSLMAAVVIALSFAGCSAVEKANENENTTLSAKKDHSNIEIPEIKSEDEVMPIYLDLSIYDVENYADVYLGKSFDYKISYAGCELSLPTTADEMSEKGWSFMPDETITAESDVMAGKYQRAQFINSDGTQITAVFYNSDKSSRELFKCNIVKLIVSENNLNNPSSVYGEFRVSGVSNTSAITDVIEYLGTPSHFYAVSPDNYYLDYFLTKSDKRSKIRVYVNISDDSVEAIELSRFE